MRFIRDTARQYGLAPHSCPCHQSIGRVADDLLILWEGDLLSRLLSAGLVMAFLSACGATGSDGPGPTAQTSISPTSPNAIEGAFIDEVVLESLASSDVNLAREAQFKALSLSPADQPVFWRNQETGVYGQVTPAQAYSVNGSNCRDFTHLVFANSETGTKKATACQRDNGSWLVLD